MFHEHRRGSQDTETESTFGDELFKPCFCSVWTKSKQLFSNNFLALWKLMCSVRKYSKGLNRNITFLKAIMVIIIIIIIIIIIGILII